MTEIHTTGSGTGSGTATGAESPDFSSIRRRQQATWASGDFAMIGNRMQLLGELLCETLDLHAGQRVLDVGAGSGNTALAAARCGCEVVASDYVPELLQVAVARAAAERLPLDIDVSAAEHLPFGDESFDVVVSTLGVMFAPDQHGAARELLRVLRRHGKIGLASWTPDGFVGEMFRLIARFVPPPAGLASPMTWGTESGLRELFPRARITTKLRTWAFRYRSSSDFHDAFRTHYGPLLRAFAALAPEDRPLLSTELLELLEKRNRAQDGTLVVPSEYLEAVIEPA